jgi:hypothetical protein
MVSQAVDREPTLILVVDFSDNIQNTVASKQGFGDLISQ